MLKVAHSHVRGVREFGDGEGQSKLEGGGSACEGCHSIAVREEREREREGKEINGGGCGDCCVV